MGKRNFKNVNRAFVNKGTTIWKEQEEVGFIGDGKN